jgi:hypothetical protein
MSDQPNTQQKEIDLLDVTGKIFSGIGKGSKSFLSWIKQLILRFFRLSKKHIWFLMILAILGIAAGFFKTRMQKPFFATEMMVETQLISRAQIADRINGLQRLLNDNNHVTLARMLDISVDEIKSVIFLKADVVNVVVETPRNHRVDDESQELGPQFIRIRIRLLDSRNVESLQQALITFIETDPYTQERLAIFRRNNLLQQSAIESELEQLKMFQQKNIAKDFSVITPGSMPFMLQAEERTYVPEILALQSRLLEIQEDFELTRPLSVIQPFFPFETPVNRLPINVLIVLTLTLSLGYLTLLICEGWKRI